MSARDILLVAVLFFVFAIAITNLHFAYNTAADKMENISDINSTHVYNALEGSRSAVNRFDYLALILFIGFLLAIIVTSFLVVGSPIFMFFYILFIIIITIVSAILSYVWETQLSSMTYIATYISTSFPITNHILQQFPIYMVITGVIGFVVMFAKPAQ